MISKQPDELVRRHADAGENPAQSALGDVAIRVNGHGNGPPVRMAYDSMAAIDPDDGEACALQCPNYLWPRHGWNTARHKT